MFSYLSNLFSPSGHPSAVLLLRDPEGGTDAVIHLVPEDGSVERFWRSFSSRPRAVDVAFRYDRTAEQSREALGTVTTGRDEYAFGFMDEVASRVRKLVDASSITFGSPRESRGNQEKVKGQEQGSDTKVVVGEAEVVRLVEEVLKPAALDALQAWEGRALPADGRTRTYHAFIVYVRRSEPDRICGEPTSQLGRIFRDSDCIDTF